MAEKGFYEDLEEAKTFLKRMEVLTNASNDRINKYKASLDQDLLNKNDKLRRDIEKKAEQDLAKERKKLYQELISDTGKSLSQKFVEAAEAGVSKFKVGFDIITNSLTSVTGTISKALNLDTLIDQIANYKSAWDTRLYGSGLKYEQLTKDMRNAVGISPYVDSSKLYTNLSTLIDEGIASNVEQRALLMTISEDIATTFNANDATLRQLIKIQQQDSTASRLGMEVALNKYLNQLYQNTEYLKGISDTVTSNLYQASSLLSAEDSIGFEYQVQKWLGSMSSSGMSSTGVGNISSALGQLASGDVSALTGGGTGTLLALAASKAGLSLGDILAGGLTDDQTNLLMYNLVDYLTSSTSGSSNVVKSQWAKMFGLNVSDLKALSSLDTSTISKSSLNNSQALGSLASMVATMGDRMSLGEKMSNLWGNTQYNVSESIAANPALYAMWKVSGALRDTMDGLDLGSVMGTSLGNVANYMRAGALGGGLISSIGSLLTSGTGAGFDMNSVISQLGANGASVAVRGGIQTGISQSSSAYIGNSSASDIGSGSILSGKETNQTISAQDTSTEVDAMMGQNVQNIYDLLEKIVSGGSSLHVSIDQYGLSGTTTWN